ncbi:hypothetical protein E3N88_18384 [Mikania micrantha]|uniref:Uncharacterized protein n=1 Tax=Mikania micrantha TaxID=192012 RepID=A0A5N6NN13_9ASTR|nr:hypothetical protein E3N88_18384 [Mikania micrantha]
MLTNGSNTLNWACSAPCGLIAVRDGPQEALSRYATSFGKFESRNPSRYAKNLFAFDRAPSSSFTSETLKNTIWKPLEENFELKNLGRSFLDHHPSSPPSYS